MKPLETHTVLADGVFNVPLSVSAATIRNWRRLGVVEVEEKHGFFSKTPLEIKSRDIGSVTSRLTSRANKTLSTATCVPLEYCEQDASQAINAIITIAKEDNISLNDTLFYSTLALLSVRDEVTILQTETIGLSSLQHWKRKNLYTEIQNWSNFVNGEITFDTFKKFIREIRHIRSDDILGAILQSFQTCGKKNSNGSYYTPSSLVDALLNDLSVIESKNINVLDPACGTGQILLRSAKWGSLSPTQLYGIELDELAWRIARVNLLLAFPDDDFSPNIIHGDALFAVATGNMFSEYNHLLGNFDIVITNPPWGAKDKQKNKGITQNIFPEIQSGESFSLFAIKCLHFAKQGGSIALFLPESILNISAHKDIRRVLLEQTNIKKINLLGRCFGEVFTKAISLVLEKTKPNPADSIIVVDEDANNAVLNRERFVANRDNIFDIFVKSETAPIIDHIYSQPHSTLRGNAEWALGIVTGNNEKFLTTEKTNETESIYRGCEIAPFRKGVHKYFISFSPERFQQTAPEWKYRAKEKIIYKFISNRLTFAYDTDATLTLNSANILIPHIDGISARIVLAFLNSSIAQFIHCKRFNTIKVLRKNLEELPIPSIPQSRYNEIETLANSAINGENNIAQIDAFFADILLLSEQQQSIINSTE